MNFSEALHYMVNKFAVRRSVWGDESTEAHAPRVFVGTILSMSGPKELLDDGKQRHVPRVIFMQTPKRLDTWTPNVDDLLADDWTVCELEAEGGE